MDDKKLRLDNTIKAIEKTLKKNKDKDNVKEAYKNLIKLKERRGLK